MENGGGAKKWGFKPNEKVNTTNGITIRGALNKLMNSINPEDKRLVVPLGHGDPFVFPCFRTTLVAEDAIVDSVRSRKFNSYSSTVGILPTRRYSSQQLIEFSKMCTMLRKVE